MGYDIAVPSRAKRAEKLTSAIVPSPSVNWMLAAIVLAGVVAFANSLHAPFILDDEDSIVRNPFITSLWPPSQALQAPAQSSLSGRPLVSLSMAVSYAIDGLSPAVFHAGNLAILIGSALVLFGIVRLTVRRVDPRANPEWLALSASLLWLLHPLQTEVVDYVTQRTESMMGLCYLMTIYSAARLIDDDRRARLWSVAAVIACALGMACKESMVTAPLMVLLYDIVFGAGTLRAAFAQRRFFYAALASTWLVLAALNFDAPRSGSAGFATAISMTDYLLNQAVMVVTYLQLSVWPHPLVLDYGRTTAIASSAAMPSLLIVLALIVVLALMWRRQRAVAFLGSWFFITLAPSSSLVPIASEVGAERRMHLPLAAIAILLVLGMRAVINRWTGRSEAVRATVLVCTALAVSAVFGAITFARNRDYYDPIAIWQGVVEHHPHGRAHYNLAIALTAAGREDEAMEHYREALPGEPAALYAIGFEASKAGRFEEAASRLAEFVRLRPADAAAPKAWLLLGEALVQLRRLDDAEDAFHNALQLSPGYADALGKLADVQFGRERYVEAIENYRAYLSLMPNTVNARHSLGLALALSGREAEAVTEFSAAVALRPADPQLRKSLGTALASTGRLDEAIAQYREGLRLAPDDDGMRQEYTAALAARK